MAFIGRLHPLLIHFPIALVVMAVGAELVAVVTGDARWRTLAFGNLRTGAAFGLVAAVAGWGLAIAEGLGPTSLVAWHRWLGTIGAGMTLVAALLTWRRSTRELRLYRIALFGAGATVIIAAHLGGLLVWGADFLRL